MGTGAVAGPRERISVIGLGVVGTSLAVVNARAGYETVCVDIDEEKLCGLRAGRSGFFEPRMDAMLADSIRRKKIRFTSNFDQAISGSEITFLTVGTPLKSDGRGVDLSCVTDAVGRIAASLKDKREFHLVAVKSTVPIRTTEDLILPAFRDPIREGRVAVVVNPEFLSEGSAIDDILRPHLIVIGASRRRDSMILDRYYRGFYGKPPEIMHTGITTAEIIKYANNAFLATKISFINSIGSICQEVPDADVNAVAYAIGRDPSIGPEFLQAGPGFGGSCLPKDLTGLINVSQKIGQRPGLFEAVREANDEQIRTITRMIVGQVPAGGIVAVLGLAFKRGTDDIREAASASIVRELLKRNLVVRVHDPAAMKNFKRIFGAGVSYSDSVAECLRGADCCAILTDWDAYRGLAPRDFECMRACNIIDARRVLNAEEFRGMNFQAVGLGR